MAVAVTFDVNIKAAVTSLLAQCRFQPALLPVVQAGETRSFHRQLLLPLDPPGSKIVQAKINEQEPRVGLTQPAVVSGTAQEEILYLGLINGYTSFAIPALGTMSGPLPSPSLRETRRLLSTAK